MHSADNMSSTLQSNLKRGKFVTQGDADLIASQHKQQKLIPIKQRIKEAEKDRFWNDFHEGINEKSVKLVQKRNDGKDPMLATGISFKNQSQDEETQRMQYGTGGGPRPKKKTFGQDRASQPVQMVVGLKDKLGMSPHQNATTRGETMAPGGGGA
jgi:hypothetical protein